jgi:predicted DsbA family dithiol-disulfide isomerase
VRWAGSAGRQDEAVEALFAAYFVEGRDVGDDGVLAGIGAALGFGEEELRDRLATEEDRAAVAAEVEAARRIGVTGVPTFILASRYGLAGAQPAEELAAALSSAYARREEAQAAAE